MLKISRNDSPLQEGDAYMSTIKDVARLAGVSVSTVSKYINGGALRRENLEAVRNAIAQLDYRVNPIARSLKTRRSHSIGILLPSLESEPAFQRSRRRGFSATR